MEYIQIPVPDFSFSEVVKLKAGKIINSRLKEVNITHGATNQTEATHSQIKAEFYELNAKEDKLVFITELLIHLFHLKSAFKKKTQIPDHLLISGEQRFNDFQHALYNLLYTITDNSLNKETFSDEEVNDLDRKIDAVLILLDKLQVGQEIIFNEIDDLKSDFRSLKSDYVLGKKRWYQRLLGIALTHTGEKGFDAILEQLKPLLKTFFTTTVPHIISNL